MDIKVGRKNEEGALYIGRGSPLGNPFVMKNEADRDRVCDSYAKWLDSRIRMHDQVVLKALNSIVNRARKQKVVLGCFCSPKRCHGEYIKEVVIKLSKEK